MARVEARKGNCYICGEEISKNTVKNHFLKRHSEPEGEENCRLIKIEGFYDKNYWMYVDAPEYTRLCDIDYFLREIWLECCGHMSAFRASGCVEMYMGTEIGSLDIGKKLVHEYDFGSTTETLVTIVAEIKRERKKTDVRLLARNIPYEYVCAKCGKPAEYICTNCMYDSSDFYFCGACTEVHEDEEDCEGMLFPITNSPRMGVCGYCGERDVYAFDPAKLSKIVLNEENKI